MSNLSDRGTLRGTLQRNSGNYNDLINKPAINGHTLIGNQSGHALGLANEDDIIYVEANPLGPATADLHKILVDDTIYSIPDVVVYGTASGAIASFDDGGDNKPLKSLKVAINPVQDLHGYDAPWPAGGGKNKLPTATGNAQTINGVTFTPQADGSVLVNGTAEAVVTYDLPVCTTWQWDGSSDYWISGCPSGGRSTTYGLRVDALDTSSYSGSDFGDGKKLTTVKGNIKNQNLNFRIVIRQGQTCNNLLFKPMLNAGLSAETYEPYSNICPISGWSAVNVSVSGVNVWDEEWEVGGYNGSNGNVWDVTDRIRSKSTNYIAIKPSTTYYNKSTASIYFFYYDKDKNYISYEAISNNITFTTPTNAYYMRFFVNATYGTTYNHDISINYPSTDTSYHAYNGQTYTIDLDGTYYGIRVNPIDGSTEVVKVGVDLGDKTWTAQTDSQGTYFRSSKPNGMKSVQSGVIPNALCSIYPVTTSTNVYDGSIAFSVGSEGYTFVRDTRFTDATAFKQAMSGVQLVYELATPLTIQLTPTQVKSLLGNNNIWSDAGDIEECVYQRDLNIAINKALSQ